MNTDDPHLKCHLKSQIIFHNCPHHHVVVLKLRCRRSCHNANKNLRNNRTGRLVVEGQSNPLFVPSVMKTHLPLTDDPVQPEEDPLQRYQERIEKLSKKGRLSKFCTDAGFLTTVEVGQYFMTEDTEDFSQFTDDVACREYTLPRDESLSEPKGWIRAYWKLQPVAYKVNMEWKSESSL